MSERYFIDGYNVLHKDPALRALAEVDLEAARHALTEAVARWCSGTDNTACLFFDGRGLRSERMGEEAGRPNVEVIFTSKHLSADALIERGVYQAEDRSRVIVVSADRGIRDLCLGMGALSMHPDNFLAMLHEARPSRTTKSAPRGQGPMGQIGDLIDEAAMEALQQLRRRLDKEK